MSRLVLGPDTDRGKWLEARRAGVTASEIAAVLGLSPYESPRSLYHKKRGEIGDDVDNDAMRWGRRLEAPIADEFADRHPEFMVEPAGLFASDVRPWQRATPDRLLFDAADCDHDIQCLDPCSDPVSVLEIKTGGSLDAWGGDDTDEIPVVYRCQVLWQMDVLDLPEARVALLAAGRTYREYTVTYDPDDVHLMILAAEEFLDALQRGTPPAVDEHQATAEALKMLHPDLDDTEVEVSTDVARGYRLAVEAEREAKRGKKAAENRLREAVGSGRYATHRGTKIATHSIYTVAEHTRKASTTDKFIPAKELFT